MSIDEQEILRRFHRTLVREIQASDPDRLQSPFTVAEIYQNLVPYRTHRDELGVQMNADYEYALLRLLAGEGDFLVMDSPSARAELREELESPNPNTGLYRDFAAAEVRLNQELIDDALSGEVDREAPENEEERVEEERVEDERVEEERAEEERADRERGEGADAMAFEPVEAPARLIHDVEGETGDDLPGGPHDEEASEEEALPEEERLPFETCPWCKENLPQRPGVRFCPFCGSNVRLVPCPACGEELELNWRFCVACGTEVA